MLFVVSKLTRENSYTYFQLFINYLSGFKSNNLKGR